MARYRRIPVVVEAWKLGVVPELMPAWLLDAIKAGVVTVCINFDNGLSITATIQTLEGEVTASNYDYIVRGVKGELYPCKRDLFEMTYVNADDVSAFTPYGELEIQLANCGQAARAAKGEVDGVKFDIIKLQQGDYGWSASYQDVLDLRIKFDNLERQMRGCSNRVEDNHMG